MRNSYAIHWFRRDLRVAGNLSLQKAFQQYGKNVVCIFFFDSNFLKRKDFSHNRFQFFLNTLKELKQELAIIGSDLLVLDSIPKKGFPQLLEGLKQRPDKVFFNRDYEPFAVKRDREISKLLQGEGISVETSSDHLVIEPNQLSKPTGGTYKVYSPFARRWLELFSSNDEIQNRIDLQKKSFQYLNKLASNKTTEVYDLKWSLLTTEKIEDKLKSFDIQNLAHVTVDIPNAGSLSAIKCLKDYKRKCDKYKDVRDFPSINGTSKLSMYLKNGSITIWQIISYLGLKPYSKKDSGKDTFFSELIWREFYYHILFHYPQVETQPFLSQYESIDWENDKKKFKLWKEGRTGFPIVDAGMRELKQTGWMHNRVRMIVASFLTKDLHIDWRWGEKYFMETLLDGDLAPNNGGWQWAASTGCDPQPYFRIFNPWLQSKRFDPQGEYIKKFIPELEDIQAKEFHKPILGHKTYPAPIVDHGERRLKALELYKSCRN